MVFGTSRTVPTLPNRDLAMVREVMRRKRFQEGVSVERKDHWKTVRFLRLLVEVRQKRLRHLSQAQVSDPAVCCFAFSSMLRPKMGGSDYYCS